MKAFFKSFGKAALYFLMYLLIQGLVGAVYGVFLSFSLLMAHDSVDPNQLNALLLSKINSDTTLILLISSTVTLLAVWLFFLVREKKLSREIQLNKCSKENIFASCLFAVGVAFVLGFLIESIPFPDHLMESFTQSHNSLRTGNLVINFITVAIIGPITEEIIFRGLIYTRLKAGMPVIAAAVISSIMFGISHGEAIWILDAFIFGLAIIWVFETTKSLYACIAVHITNNTIAQITQYLPQNSRVMDLCITAVCAAILVCSVLYLRKINSSKNTETDTL